MMKVNDRVKFVGPAYRHTNGPLIGQLGTVKNPNSGFAQLPGGPKEQLITVHFDGDEKDSVVNLNRVEVIS